jgi:hypothetical protein
VRFDREMRGDPPTRDALEHEALIVGGEVRKDWNSLTEEQKDAYVERLAANAKEPPELTALLEKPGAEERWRSAHWLVRAEFCAFITDAKFGWQRRWRARTVLRDAAKYGQIVTR